MATWLHQDSGRPMAYFRSHAAVNLELAVPLAIASLRDLPGPVREKLASECAGLLERHGDLAWLAVRAHEDPEGLTVLARGLAALACRPGGVTFLGMCWAAVLAWDEGQEAA